MAKILHYVYVSVSVDVFVSVSVLVFVYWCIHQITIRSGCLGIIKIISVVFFQSKKVNSKSKPQFVTNRDWQQINGGMCKNYNYRKQMELWC